MKKVIFSQRAYRSILAEVYERVDTETGGILLGHRDGDKWYVLESVEPGPKSIFTPTYFEYDDEYVTYRANKLRRLYKCSIELLGLWHRHPGIMKIFSSTDDRTNKTYSDLLGGAISGIVTLGKGFEITMYYVPGNIRYEKMEWVVDDTQIPADYLEPYKTDYYEKLINDTAEKEYGKRYMDREEREETPEVREETPEHEGTPEHEETPEHRYASDGNADQSRVTADENYKKGLFVSAVKFLVNAIDGVLETAERSGDKQNTGSEYSNIDTEENDAVRIFDIIEPEIAYLQELEADGKLKVTIQQKKNRQGRNALILNITDLRHKEPREHRLLFYMDKGRVAVKDDDGNTRLYADNYIFRSLGGKE